MAALPRGKSIAVGTDGAVPLGQTAIALAAQGARMATLTRDQAHEISLFA
jgi:hypothetical protein